MDEPWTVVTFGATESRSRVLLARCMAELHDTLLHGVRTNRAGPVKFSWWSATEGLRRMAVPLSEPKWATLRLYLLNHPDGYLVAAEVAAHHGPEPHRLRGRMARR